MHCVDLKIPLYHLSAEGHFPGNPIVPGALLLSEVVRSWEQIISAPLENMTIKVAKFLSPTRPGDTISVQFERLNASSVKFRCAVRETTVLTGHLNYSIAAATS